MAINKVQYGSSVLIDLTEDTIVADKLKRGLTAHDKSGVQIVGTSDSYPLEPYVYDHNIGYVDNGTWKYEKPTKTYTDIYEAKAGNDYLIVLGGIVGTRFRVMFTTTDITTITSGNIVGTRIINVNNPAPHAIASYSCGEDGFILVAKDNIGHSGLNSYVYDLTAGCI